MNMHTVYIILTILVMITFFVMLAANAIGAVKTFIATPPSFALVGEIVVLIGSAGIAYWLGMLFYRFIA